MDKKNKKLVNNTFLFLLGSIGSKFIQFLLVPLYTYTLTTSQYGVTDIFFTTINFIIPIVSIQISDGLLRFGLSKKHNLDDVITASFRIAFFGTMVSILISPAILLIPELKKWICYFVIILNLQIYRDLLSIVLKIKDLNKKYAINSIVYTTTLCIFNFIFLAILKLGISGYFWAFIISNIISILYLLKSTEVDLKVFICKSNKKTMQKIAVYSLPLVINSISYWITMASDRYMINIFLGISSVGIYAVACKIPTIITTLSGVFNQAWMISSINEYENEKDSSFYSETFNNYTGIMLIFSSILILILKWFMLLYVSPDYYIAWKYTSILIISAIFAGICAFINGIFYAYKKNISITITTTLGAFINIILNLILIPVIGILGASLATAISWIMIAIIRIYSIKKIIPFEINLKKLFFSIIIIVTETIVISYLPSIAALIINVILVCFILYNEKSIIGKIINLLSEKKKLIVKKIRATSRKKIDIHNREKLTNKDFTIICSNCTAGVIYHNLGLRFNTPTINMYIEPKDFIKLCQNLKHYMSCNMIEVPENSEYPVALLDDIKLYGVHYKNFDEMFEKWDIRKKRINYKNIFIIMTERDGCTYEDLINFDGLKFKNKIVFTHKKYDEIKTSYHVKGTSNKNNNYQKTKSLTDYISKVSYMRYLDEWDYVGWLNKNEGDQ